MSSGHDSLAEQAAAWVPPWERQPAAARQPTEDDRGEPDTSPDPARDGTDQSPADRQPDEPDAASLAAVPVEADIPDADVPDAEVPDAALDTTIDAALDTTIDTALDTTPDTPAAVSGADASKLDDPAGLRSALEAILLVVDEPVTEVLLAQVLDRPVERITAALRELAGAYTAQRRGFDLRRAAGGWRLYTREEFAPYVERFVLDGQQLRLTQAALETLAVVAYKQPVSRSRISAIRGVSCDGVVRTLVTRGLIEECGTEPETGARLYATTQLFLEKLGMDSVTELPPLAPFLPDDIDEVADAQP